MNDNRTKIGDLKRVVESFVDERDWKQFHSPKNLAMALSVEVSELMELFQWLDLDEAKEAMKAGEVREDALDEVADILIYLLAFCNSNNIDIRVRQIDFSDDDDAPLFPWLGQSIVDFEENQAALLIGSHLRKDQPIINHRLRKAALNGASIMALNPIDYEFNFPLHQTIISSPNNMVSELSAILKAVIKLSGMKVNTALNKLLVNTNVDKNHQEIINHSNDDELMDLAHNLKEGVPFATPVFDGAKESDISSFLEEAGVSKTGQEILVDGITGEKFERPVTVGYIYMLKPVSYTHLTLPTKA